MVASIVRNHHNKQNCNKQKQIINKIIIITTWDQEDALQKPHYNRYNAVACLN
jgi:hypothetical protein